MNKPQIVIVLEQMSDRLKSVFWAHIGKVAILDALLKLKKKNDDDVRIVLE